MRREQAWLYFCDFCGKANRSAATMSRHEKHCTANPNRRCGMCKAAGLRHRPMSELITAFQTSAVIEEFMATECLSYDPPHDRRVLAKRYDYRKGISALIDLEVCPACILAATRQSGFPHQWPDEDVLNWNYQDAKKEFWSNVNDAAYQAQQRCY